MVPRLDTEFEIKIIIIKIIIPNHLNQIIFHPVCTQNKFKIYPRSPGAEYLGDSRLFPDILPVIVHVITELFIFVNDFINFALSLNISHPDIQ